MTPEQAVGILEATDEMTGVEIALIALIRALLERIIKLEHAVKNLQKDLNE